MFNVVLIHPEIPPNTGNVIRLCANAGCSLHLIEPLGFPLDDARMRRAGLDYHEFATLQVHPDWPSFLRACSPARLFVMTTRAERMLGDVRFQPGDWLAFGSETSGIPDALRAGLSAEQLVRIPMRPHNRSLNLSNAVAICVYEAWRQNGYQGSL